MTGIQNWTVGKKVGDGFVASGVVAAILIAVFEVGMSSLVRYQTDAASWKDNALVVVEAAGTAAELYQVVADAQINQKFAETHENWTAMTKTADKRLAAIGAIVKTDEERAALDEATTHYRGMVQAFEGEMLPLLEKTHKLSEATQRLDDKVDEEAAGMAEPLQKLAANMKDESTKASGAFAASAASTQRIALITSLVGVLVSALVGFLVVTSVAKRLRGVAASLTDGAQQLLSASGQVSGSAQSLSQGATEQAASLEETSASMEEMASMTRKNAENTHQAAGLMADVHSQVTASHDALGHMVASMSAIQESSHKVSKIIKTIDEIAFQTNILALNAAVEAARAGEAGMGFAVVADEVRNLAQRSAQAAKDTAGLIEESIIKAQTGSQKVEQVAGAITGITEGVTRVKGLIEEVSEASRQQAQGIDQVSQAIAQMEKVTQTTAATAEESAAASEELNGQARNAMIVIEQLEAVVGGGGRDRASAPAIQAPAPSGPSRRNVVKLSPRSRPAAKAEDLLPLENTGTYGSF